MSGENSGIEIPPGFDHIYLAKTLPSTTDQSSVLAQVSSMATKETPTVPLPPVPPLGLNIDAPLIIPCDADEEHSDEKINLNPLSILSPPPNPRNEGPSPVTEETKIMISNVKSVLVFQLTSASARNIEIMVKCANNAFSNLDFLEADYASFYKDVKDFISYQCNLHKAERLHEMQSFPELKKQYEDAMSCANDLNNKIICTQGQLEAIMKKKEPLERQIAEAMEKIARLKQFLAFIEEGEETLKRKKQEYVATHNIANHEVEKLCRQVEGTKDVLMEIDQRRYEALNGIESTIRRLKSIQS